MAILGKHSIGQMLVQAGKINNDQLQSALNMQENKDVYIGSIFKELGYLNDQELYRYLSMQMKIPFINLRYYQIEDNIVDLIERELQEHTKFFHFFD